MITIEEINEVIEKFDKAFRPYVLFMHTEDAKMLLEIHPEIEDKVVINKTNLVEKGKCYLINREYYESFMNGLISFQMY